MKELENPYGSILEVRRWRNIEGKKLNKWGVFLRAQMAVSSEGDGTG